MIIAIRFFVSYGEKSTLKCADSLNHVFVSYNEIIHFFVRSGENFAGPTSQETESTLSVFAVYKKSDTSWPVHHKRRIDQFSSVSALGGVTEYTYDAHKRKIAEEDPRGAITRYGYNSLDQLVVTDTLGFVTRYEYDDRGHQEAVIDPLGRRTERHTAL